MQQITTKLPDHTIESLDDVAQEEHGGNRSEAIRELITEALEADEQTQQYEERIENLENERDRLQRQLAATNARQDDVDELVEYVEAQREAERERSRREQRRREANVLQRGWWWITGEPSDGKNE